MTKDPDHSADQQRHQGKEDDDDELNAQQFSGRHAVDAAAGVGFGGDGYHVVVAAEPEDGVLDELFVAGERVSDFADAAFGFRGNVLIYFKLSE